MTRSLYDYNTGRFRKKQLELISRVFRVNFLMLALSISRDFLLAIFSAKRLKLALPYFLIEQLYCQKYCPFPCFPNCLPLPSKSEKGLGLTVRQTSLYVSSMERKQNSLTQLVIFLTFKHSVPKPFKLILC